MKELLREFLFDLGLVIAPYAIMIGIAAYNVYHPTYPYEGSVIPDRQVSLSQQEEKDIKQIEYMDVIKRQYEESHAYCHYCREYFHKDDLHEVFIFLACEDCYKEASQIDYSQFCE